MRAVLIKDGKGPVENLYIGEVPTPSPANGQILVQVTIAIDKLEAKPIPYI